MPCVALSIQQAPSNYRRGFEWQRWWLGGAEKKALERSANLLTVLTRSCPLWQWSGRNPACLRVPGVLARALTPGEEGTDTSAAGPQAFRTVSCEVAFEVLPLQPDRVSRSVAGADSLKIACGWNGKVSF